MTAVARENAREAILLAAREAAMTRGYGGINFRDLAATVGIKAASINYYFASKALLGEAVARRYHEDIARDLEAIAGTALARPRWWGGEFIAGSTRAFAALAFSA